MPHFSLSKSLIFVLNSSKSDILSFRSSLTLNISFSNNWLLAFSAFISLWYCCDIWVGYLIIIDFLRQCFNKHVQQTVKLENSNKMLKSQLVGCLNLKSLEISCQKLLHTTSGNLHRKKIHSSFTRFSEPSRIGFAIF